jgi:hypothetical protein
VCRWKFPPVKPSARVAARLFLSVAIAIAASVIAVRYVRRWHGVTRGVVRIGCIRAAGVAACCMRGVNSIFVCANKK